MPESTAVAGRGGIGQRKGLGEDRQQLQPSGERPGVAAADPHATTRWRVRRRFDLDLHVPTMAVSAAGNIRNSH